MTRILLLASLAVAAAAGDGPRLFYSKTFPGSKPPYMEIRLDRDGRAEYRESPDEEFPTVFRLRPHETRVVWELSEKLDHFRKPLESGLKVARMGDKLLRWEHGEERHEARFNHTLDPDAQLLHDWFERMCESAILQANLERAVKYDRLGVNQAILLIEAAWDRKRLVGVDQYVPLLKRVAANSSYLNMARERAEKLLALFQQPEAAGQQQSGAEEKQ
ncbi:MAG: hypothetical protein WHT08_01980 [Bryobacteraceae bacterium]